jgi:hypothetical protein
MAKRTKRKVKQRSKAHKKWVGKKRKVRKRAASKIGYGARKRRKKKLNKKK